MKKLYLMVGEPGSGKSTFLKNYQKEVGGVIVSRDEIRFSMLGENDAYFSKEDAVFSQYSKSIQKALKTNDIVFADATQITRGSRKKLLKSLNLKGVEVRPIVMITPLNISIKNNNNREGRSKVPENVIKRMFNQWENPIYDDFDYSDILYYFYNQGVLTRGNNLVKR